jgi:hypothetical protein
MILDVVPIQPNRLSIGWTKWTGLATGGVFIAKLPILVIVCVAAQLVTAQSQPFPTAGAPNPAMIETIAPGPAAPITSDRTPRPILPPILRLGVRVPASAVQAPGGTAMLAGEPRAVMIARATAIPLCTSFVDASVTGGGTGTVQSPHKRIADAIANSAPGAIICVTEGTYTEQLRPGKKHLTLAGGFQRGSNFRVRDSARHVSRAQGHGGSFFRVEDPGPSGEQLTVIDGFEITGYSQAIVRDIYYSQRFNITNNTIHGNRCTDQKLAGAGFALNNISGRIAHNVLRNNACGRGGAGFINDETQQNNVEIEANLFDANAGTEPDSAHGGALYVFGKSLKITANLFTNNTVTQWGAGLYIGAWPEGGQNTTAALSWNVYRGNRAGNSGGGMFCDGGATCLSDHEIYARNCGGNILLDSGGGGANIAKFRHMTNFGALDVGCNAAGAGVRIDRESGDGCRLCRKLPQTL